MQDFKNLKVWTRAHQLTLGVYGLTKPFPKEELFGLTSQLRRACSSIPANIAEGCGKSTDLEFARFLQIAFGSSCEVEYHLLLAKDLDYLDPATYESTVNELIEIKRMLASLIGKLRADR